MKNFITKMTRFGLAGAGSLFAVLLFTSATLPKADAALTSQMSVGSTGSDVTQLQQFLATNPSIYPAGIVSGYYGALTQAAVTQFQVNYDISQVGNVGPITEAKLNDLMATGFGLDTTAPFINNLAVQQINPTTATVTWTTNVLARGQVFYATNPIQANEATGHDQLPYIGGAGSSANSNTNVGNSVAIQLVGLQPNTFYYYVARSIDQSGNVSMTQTQSFQTN